MAGNLYQILTMIFLSVFITIFASTVTYHRLLSHRSWNAPKWFEIFGSLLGIFSFTGSTISRTAVHRQHHKFVDTDKDPHSPKHHGRFFVYFPIKNNENLSPKLVMDLISDPLHRFIHRFYLLIILSIFFLVSLFAGINWAFASVMSPGALCWISIAMLNMYGHSKITGPVDNPLINLITFGEGNHKFHHENPTNPNIGQGKFDVGFFIIKLLEKKI
jgi:stearoyl-CoA desaturase (delta-9 desaturase)